VAEIHDLRPILSTSVPCYQPDTPSRMNRLAISVACCTGGVSDMFKQEAQLPVAELLPQRQSASNIALSYGAKSISIMMNRLMACAHQCLQCWNKS